MHTTKYKFHKLTPTRDVELGIYADALDYVFQDNDLENIAITGPYSSGKSSVIETYKAANRDKKFIHISLAHFESGADLPKESNSKEKNDDKAEKRKACDQKFEADIKSVEGKILNQLIHQMDPKAIPQTHFKIKRPFYPEKMLVISAALTVFFLTLIFLFNRSTWSVFVDGISKGWLRRLLEPTISGWFAVISIVVCSLLFLWGIYNVFKMQHNKKVFRKLSLQGNEIEIFQNDDDSFFDKYLNEVIYLFNSTKVDAIIFEDMDRYNTNQVFEKLREINHLMNNTAEQKGTISQLVTKLKCKIFKKDENKACDKVFRFFYLIRDDIFTSKDRTKFFDFIIPIVPVISGSNSYDKFIGYFKEGEILERFDSEFLQEIAMYIDDMRLLKNIYNEYQIYYERIQSTELSSNKLLGIIAYKNLFPRDFSELQLGKGFVFCMFRNKYEYINDEIGDIEERIEEIQKLIISSKNDQLENVHELDALYLNDVNCTYDVDNKKASQFTTRSEFIKVMKENGDKIYSTTYHYHRSPTRDLINMVPEFERIHSIPEYKRRREIIDAKSLQKKSELNNELNQLKNRKTELQGATLSEIIGISREMASKVFGSRYTDEINTVYKYEDVKESIYFPLIKYLVRNKHVDENYADYMSYFYEESMSRQDQIFVRSVFDHEAKPVGYALQDAEIVANKISPRYYSQEEVLNFDLFTFLLQSNNENLHTFLNQLYVNVRIDFIIKYWETNKQNCLLFKNINKVWPGIWDELLGEEGVGEGTKKGYLINTFYYSSYEDINRMNVNCEMTNYISLCSDFLDISRPRVNLIIEAFKELDIQFFEINYDKSNKQLFNEIYTRNMYKINKSMVFLILEKVYKITESEDFYHKNYSLLMAEYTEPLAQYINRHMDTYLGMVINICKGKITDIEKYAIALINHQDGHKKDKEDYIRFLETKIREIILINDHSLWPLLLSQGCVPCSQNNIIYYYFEASNGFDQTLTDFINASELEGTLEYDDILEDYEEEQVADFYDSVITNNMLENKQYTNLQRGFKRVYPEFRFIDIENDKMEILIEFEIIEMNPINLDFIRENYNACKQLFILKNIEEYAQSTIDNDLFDLSEVEYLIKEKVADENLLKLLSFTEESIPIEGMDISDAVKKHIIENNYYDNDLDSLILNYEKESQKIKETLLKLCIREVTKIVANDISLPYILLIRLLESSEISNKRELLAGHINDLSLVETMECLKRGGVDDLFLVFEGRWASVQIEEHNTFILEIMQERGWLSSYVENHDKPGYYEVRAKRKIKNKEELPDEIL